MKECEHHARTVAAGRANEADAHAAECERCGETLLVARALDRLARSASQAPPPAVDARALFRRSQFVVRLLGEQRTADRTAGPLAFAQVVALAALAGAIGWALLGGGTLGPLAGDPSTGWRLAPALARLALWPLAVGALAAAATARFLWVED